MHEVFDVVLASEAFHHPWDPGFIYLLEDRGRYKIGRTKSPKHRLSVAKTWVPDFEMIGMKPFWFHSELETYVHVGLANFSYKGEWFDFAGNEFEETFIGEFKYFTNDDPIKNTRSFTYFMNGTNMSEFTLEWTRQKNSKRSFLSENSLHTPKR